MTNRYLINWKSAFAVMCGVAIAPVQTSIWSATPGENDLSQRIAAAMLSAPDHKPGHRPLHAKGVLCEGTFKASSEASGISRAAHFAGAGIPVRVRLSDGAGDPSIPDNSPDASPRGLAIRFMLPGGSTTDIVAISHNGFLVGTGEEFLELLIAKGATDPSKPHPWPIEKFLGAHPRALKFVQDPKPTPASYGTQEFFANNAFRFVNQKGEKQTGRYQLLPVAGAQYLTDAEAKAKSPDFLAEELKSRLAQGSVKFRLVLQLAADGDPTADSSQVWPDDRKKVELGIITIASVVPDSQAVERTLMFDPARLTDGIELSDDPLPALRSRVYAISLADRLRTK